MKLNRIIAYLTAGLALASSFLVYTKYIYLLGFPDGFITELGYTEQKLAYIFIGISVIFSSWFIYLGSISLEMRSSVNSKKIRQKLFISIFLYLVILASISLLDFYYYSNLKGGGGG